MPNTKLNNAYVQTIFTKNIFGQFQRPVSQFLSHLIERHLEVDAGQVHHHGHGEAVRVRVEIGSQRHHHPTVNHVPGNKLASSKLR